MAEEMSKPLGFRQADKICLPNSDAGPLTDRWALLDLVVDLRKALELTDRDISVLRAHLSVLPHGPLRHGNLNMSYMDVSEIAGRACGMEERRFRRGEVKLARAGLILRHLSANGRRFPERDGSGQIVSAYGIDLNPLLAREADLRQMQAALRAEQYEIRKKKNAASARFHGLVKMSGELSACLKDALERLRVKIRQIIRRETTTASDIDAIEAEIDALETQLPEPPSVFGEDPAADALPPRSAAERSEPPRPADDALFNAEPLSVVDVALQEFAKAAGVRLRLRHSPSQDKTAVDAGQSVRHIESKPKEHKERQLQPKAHHMDLRSIWSRAKSLADVFPVIPRSRDELDEVIFIFSKYLGLRQEISVRTVSTLGRDKTLLALDYLAEKITEINCPEAYLSSMLTRYQRGEKIAAGRIWVHA